MNPINQSSSSSRRLILGAGVSFLLFQFILHLSSGIVIGAIMAEMNLTASTAGLLGSVSYLVYAGFQIPVGILFDRKNTRTLFAVNALLCGLGCFLFAASHSLLGLFLARLLIGAGSSFAFVGFSHLLRQHFPLKHFAFMIGLSETIAFILTVFTMISLGKLLSGWGWRFFMNISGFSGLCIAAACWKLIPNRPPVKLPTPNYGAQILQIIKNKWAWMNGIFVGLTFTVVTVFGALWVIPFIQVKLNCALPTASLLGAMFFLGAGISCPLFGFLSNLFERRKPLILSSCISTACFLLIALYWPIQSHFLMGLLILTIGCCCGAYMLAFSIANEIAPANSLSTCTGFTNTLATVTAPILQSLIGYLLDVFGEKGNYTLHDYQTALLCIPISLLIACVLVFFLPEKQT